MTTRLSMAKAAPGAIKAMRELTAYMATTDLEKPLLELVKIRASQINSCAFCLHMHVEEARKLGESEERIHLLNAWHEAGIYTPREQAALAWTESLTLVAETHVPDAVYDEARKHFSESELANLSLAIVTINAWNRLMVAFRAPPQLKKAAHAAE
jgi:AhpD family alkylhydroperoxidase